MRVSVLSVLCLSSGATARGLDIFTVFGPLKRHLSLLKRSKSRTKKAITFEFLDPDFERFRSDKWSFRGPKSDHFGEISGFGTRF